MTLEQILKQPADVIEKMTDKELNELFTPFFTVTRPSIVRKEAAKAAPSKVVNNEERVKNARAQAILREILGDNWK